MTTTTGTFHHFGPSSTPGKPWTKVDGPDKSFQDVAQAHTVHDLRGREHEFTTDNSGFAVLASPAREKLFTSDEAVRGGYYAEVEALLRAALPGTIRKIHIFDHTVRRRQRGAPRQPVQQLHIDQTAGAAAARVRRHLPPAEAEELLRGGHRWQIVNVWRPIECAVSDFPLAVVDWRTTEPRDFVAVDLMYPCLGPEDDNDDRGKERLPGSVAEGSTEGYEPRGEHVQVAYNEKHRFYYVKDMTPEEVLLIKCYDSFGEGQPNGVGGVAVGTPHSAFHDPNSAEDAPPRQSIEVRCLVFYE